MNVRQNLSAFAELEAEALRDILALHRNAAASKKIFSR